VVELVCLLVLPLSVWYGYAVGWVGGRGLLWPCDASDMDMMTVSQGAKESSLCDARLQDIVGFKKLEMPDKASRVLRYVSK